MCGAYPKFTKMLFISATILYQQLLDVSGQKGQLFIPKPVEKHEHRRTSKEEVDKNELVSDSQPSQTSPVVMSRHSLHEMVDHMCETNYKQFEAQLRCGSFYKLECPICIWPPPLPFKEMVMGNETVKIISKKLEITGFISLADIGSPMSISRHLILPKSVEIPEPKHTKDKSTKAGGGSSSSSSSSMKSSIAIGVDPGAHEYERLEYDIKQLYAKHDGYISDDEAKSAAPPNNNDPSTKESVCVLLHGALKVENMAALVLLNDDWFGFIYSYADSKKKSNLMLTVLPPGHDIIPWLGDLRYLGTIDDALPGENPSIPVKPTEKRSYSQNIVVWIRHSGLQSDIQKVLRHAKKLPEKTQHFYKELNRIRRAALSLGFVELLEGLSVIFEREIGGLPSTASPDCTIQLKHVAKELKKPANRDLKSVITAFPSKYNQLNG